MLFEPNNHAFAAAAYPLSAMEDVTLLTLTVREVFARIEVGHWRQFGVG